MNKTIFPISCSFCPESHSTWQGYANCLAKQVENPKETIKETLEKSLEKHMQQIFDDAHKGSSNKKKKTKKGKR